MLETTELSFISLNSIITKNINREKPMCMYVFLRFVSCLFISRPNISMQNEVVSAVRAESAEEYAAAVIPKRKSIPAASPK